MKIPSFVFTALGTQLAAATGFAQARKSLPGKPAELSITLYTMLDALMGRAIELEGEVLLWAEQQVDTSDIRQLEATVQSYQHLANTLSKELRLADTYRTAERIALENMIAEAITQIKGPAFNPSMPLSDIGGIDTIATAQGVKGTRPVATSANKSKIDSCWPCDSSQLVLTISGFTTTELCVWVLGHYAPLPGELYACQVMRDLYAVHINATATLTCPVCESKIIGISEPVAVANPRSAGSLPSFATVTGRIL